MSKPSIPQCASLSEFNVNTLANIPTFTRQTNDDVSVYVPATQKQRICKGEYVNLALLLKGAMELAEYTNGNLFFFVLNNGMLENRPRECKDDIGSIER